MRLFLNPQSRLACFFEQSTLPEAAEGSWALDFLLHPPVPKEDGWFVVTMTPAESHNPPDHGGGDSASTKVGGTLLSLCLSNDISLL